MAIRRVEPPSSRLPRIRPDWSEVISIALEMSFEAGARPSENDVVRGAVDLVRKWQTRGLDHPGVALGGIEVVHSASLDARPSRACDNGDDFVPEPAQNKKTPRSAGLSQAADGARTHDLLHGKSSRKRRKPRH
jgi:hypothetical protein